MWKVKAILIIIGILLVLIVLIVITKIHVTIRYHHKNDDDSLKIECKAWFGLIKYKLDVPLIKIDDNSPTLVAKSEVKKGENEETKSKDTKQFTVENLVDSLKDAKTLLEHVVSLHRIVRQFFRKVQIHNIEWHTVAGVGDAALTGMLSGAIWALKGSLIGLISHYFRLMVMPKISVQPHFQAKVTQTFFMCMITFRIGNAMLAGIKLVKYWKGGRPKFKTKPLSALSDKTKSI